MVVTVEDLRFFLKNMPEDFVSDETIEMQIDLAEWFISHEKSSQADDESLDKATLIRAAYFTTLAYMQEAERALGIVPPSLAALVSELKNLQLAAIEIIKRGNIYSIPLSLATLSGSAWDYAGGGSTIKTSTG